jgi:hypothetical protein
MRRERERGAEVIPMPARKIPFERMFPVGKTKRKSEKCNKERLLLRDFFFLDTRAASMLAALLYLLFLSCC